MTATSPDGSPPRWGIYGDKYPPYEIIDGKYVEKPFAGTFGNGVVCMIAFLLGDFVRKKQLGDVRFGQIFRLSSDSSCCWRPSVAYVSYDRWAHDRDLPCGDMWDVVPDLMVEVIGSRSLSDETIRRVEEYFAAGTQQLWIAYPKQSKIYVYDSPVSVRILQPGDQVNGGNLLPGLSIPVAELFDNAN